MPFSFPRSTALPLLLVSILSFNAGAQVVADPPPEAASAPAAEAPPPPPPPSCAQMSNRAMAADMKAVTAQSQHKDLDSVVRLFDEAITLWTQAVDRCDSRGRERAQRNLADNVKQRAALAERQSAGEQCEGAHRDAASLQELARVAFGERRWPEAATLYRKAETMWDLAAEQCSGTQQAVATQRREQSEIDGHNAEFCAPLFDRAREQTQRFRSAASGLSPADKQQQLQQGETLWREAAAQCRGNASELARNNGQALARERGTPWVATAPPAPPAAAPAAPTKAAALAKAGANAPAAEPPQATAAAPVPDKGGGLFSGVASTLGSVVRPPVDLSAGPAAALAVKELDVQSGDTHYKGQFVRQEGQVVSGTGRVEWSNGDAYEGPLVRNQRHGKGEFVWANGQRYKGDWVNDKPTGQGQILFPAGSRYEGQVVDGVPEGQGEMAHASGDRYTGQLRQGLPHGRGVYVWVNGQRFEGDWVNDTPQGRGALRYANGNLYEGAMAAGKPQGQGVMKFASGDSYEGTFEQGAQHGQGVYRWKSGDRYEGAWRTGQKHGTGTFFWVNGDRWEGVFKDDQRTEDGVILRKEDEPPPALVPTSAPPLAPPAQGAGKG